MKKLFITAVLILALSTVGVYAKQYNYNSSDNELEISFKFGYFMPNGDSELWDYNREIFDFSEEDLNSFVGTIGFNFHLNNF
ncbi:MAG: hypothetical protein JW737_03175, partial [Acidobacteria bacterium]|nr:hypothetical protein [Acidobacteriota bacterium]